MATEKPKSKSFIKGDFADIERRLIMSFMLGGGRLPVDHPLTGRVVRMPELQKLPVRSGRVSCRTPNRSNEAGRK